MSHSSLASADTVPPTTSVGAKLLDVLASPSEVLAEVAAARAKHVNWLLPTMLVCVTGLILQAVTWNKAQLTAAIGQLSQAGPFSTAQVDWLSKNGQLIAGSGVCLAAFAGIFWSALVIWWIGRIPLKRRF